MNVHLLLGRSALTEYFDHLNMATPSIFVLKDTYLPGKNVSFGPL